MWSFIITFGVFNEVQRAVEGQKTDMDIRVVVHIAKWSSKWASTWLLVAKNHF